ncbi:MAG: HAD-IIIA family hydrolase [Fervidobacterium sp.]|nr:HAD-IIIA family hydrolase [Fervidobacterium sp.]
MNPDQKVDSLKDIDFDKLIDLGKDVFLFDFDNTINTWRSEMIPEHVKEIFRYLKSKGAIVVIVSNGKRRIINEDVFVIWRAMKPFPFKVLKKLSKVIKSRKNVVVIGDQIFTDVLFGKLIGAYTIKVKPIDTDKEFVLTKLLRFLEKLFKLH